MLKYGQGAFDTVKETLVAVVVVLPCGLLLLLSALNVLIDHCGIIIILTQYICAININSLVLAVGGHRWREIQILQILSAKTCFFLHCIVIIFISGISIAVFILEFSVLHICLSRWERSELLLLCFFGLSRIRGVNNLQNKR